MRKIKINSFIKLLVPTLSLFFANHALAINHVCPPANEIQTTDFTVPTVWLAPPVAQSKPNQVGVGIGGTKVKALLGSEGTKIMDEPGWVCIYESEGGFSISQMQHKLKELIESKPFLKKYLSKLIADQPAFLKKYPQDVSLGYIGYQYDNSQR